MATFSNNVVVSSTDLEVLREQRALTNDINTSLIQVGAIYLRPKSKLPAADDWAARKYLDTNLQDWIDDPELLLTNVGFNLQTGWLDIDIDSCDPEYNRCVLAALQHLNIDARFAFGRRSVGAPTHFFVQLTEEDAANYEELKRFEPRELRLGNERHKIQLRTSIPSNNRTQALFAAQQTVMPGSLYTDKIDVNGYDISVWWGSDGRVARHSGEVANTTSRRVTYRELIRAVAFGTILYLIKPHWVEGSRQNIAMRIFGWLARVVISGEATNNNEQLTDEVYCPIDCDQTAESLIELICAATNDNEPFMRKRTYHDARRKLDQNPDAKIPGWPAMEQLFGAEIVGGLRGIVAPGIDTSILSMLLERYIYNDANGRYIDRERFDHRLENFEYSNSDLYQRHKPETIMIAGKPREAFKSFEMSKQRISVQSSDLYPDYNPGAILRRSPVRGIVPDDYQDDSHLVFNTWPGWAVQPCAVVNPELMKKCEGALNTVLSYLTCGNEVQMDWIKNWFAYTLQHPADKQQIAWVALGGQGVGKSVMGNLFCNALFRDLHGLADSGVIGERFSISPFVNKMLVFVDEAKFKSKQAIDATKLLIRTVRAGGEQKNQDPRQYNIYARMIFASNELNIGISRQDTIDRALYITKAHTPEQMGMSNTDFILWANSLKPMFAEFVDMLNNYQVIEHFMYMFMHRQVTKAAVENVVGSAATSADFIANNLSIVRKIAKEMIENGEMLEHLDITTPFNNVQFLAYANDYLRKIGVSKMNPSTLLGEFKALSMLEDFNGKLRFRWKIAELHQKFGEAIGVPLTPQYIFTEADYGPNDNDGSKPVPWRGAGIRRF